MRLTKNELRCRLKRVVVQSAILSAAVISISGCVRRRLTVRTVPAGAQVFVDRQPIGVTPVSDNFTYYGTRQIDIIKDGYRTESFMRTFNPPWYQIPPLDFVFETLYPFEKRDERIIDVAMIPDPDVPTEALLASAEELRLQARNGVAVLPPGQTRGSTDPTLPSGTNAPAPLYPYSGDSPINRSQPTPFGALGPAGQPGAQPLGNGVLPVQPGLAPQGAGFPNPIGPNGGQFSDGQFSGGQSIPPAGSLPAGPVPPGPQPGILNPNSNQGPFLGPSPITPGGSYRPENG